MTPIETTAAPAAIGPYSQAMRVGNLLFVSGQLPIDPATGAFASDEPVGQMRQCMTNIAAIAAAAGTDISSTVKTTILVTDLGQFAQINEAYGAVFTAPFPARACYQVAALPKGAQVEVEAVIAC
ncbi:reactive intermediate/imine deaminase [Thioclava sp. SK-1]|uniref:Rid family detoxifying hydrolase n=1 Tax=Thioclava sp. SK-1 TaxID=1889770 RepID=UPI000825803A|nr:Rid family detoxifying hydrolase [Thioclava sp. SK-1]OCX64464.1 reactive intermediate/imine deaminase [Thioclava sp. SK-1]